MDMLNQEKFITIFIVLAALWVAFKIASAILKPIIYIGLLWCLYMFVYHPAMLRTQLNESAQWRNRISAEVSSLSPAANYAVSAFNECVRSGVQNNSIEACKTAVSQIALKEGGTDFAGKANDSINLLISKLNSKPI